MTNPLNISAITSYGNIIDFVCNGQPYTLILKHGEWVCQEGGRETFVVYWYGLLDGPIYDAILAVEERIYFNGR